MMKILFLESAVALVPPKYRNHPTVRNWCKRFGRKPHEAVLDVNYHTFMKDWEHPGKWGRPDILHFSLLYALESPLSQAGLLEVYVHTVENKLFYIESDTRLPRGYARFIGIISKVLRGFDTPKVHPVNVEVSRLIKTWMEEGYKVVLFDEKGSKKKGWEWKEKVVALIGAFAGGPFLREYPYHEKISLWDYQLNTWNVTGEVIAYRERALGLM